MDQIATSVKDPSWWFTVFFVGIIVSILAGFLKDWVANAFAKYAGIFRARRKAKAERREALFEALADNETYLILSLVRLMGLTILSILLLWIFASLPAMLEMKEILCKVAGEAKPCNASTLKLSKFYITLVGGLAMLTNYRASSRFSLVMEGVKRYRVRRNLPKVV